MHLQIHYGCRMGRKNHRHLRSHLRSLGGSNYRLQTAKMSTWKWFHESIIFYKH